MALQILACQPTESPSTNTAAGEPQNNQSQTAANTRVTIEIHKKVELREDRSNIEEFKNNLNLYVAKIRIPEDVFVEDIKIRTSKNPSALNPKYTQLAKSEATYENGFYQLTETLNLWQQDFNVKTVIYKIIGPDSTIEEVSFELYPDLVVPGEQNQTITLASLGILSGNYRFGVLFLEKGTVLSTQGASIKFQVDRLYADEARIESFSVHQANVLSSYGEAGRSGGRFTLQAVSAVGQLTFEMRGTAGGKGYPALVQDKKASVRPPGAPGVFEHYCDAPIWKSPRSGPMDLKNRRMGRCEMICVKDPEDGLPGENGFDGFPGGKGGAGGASGFAEVFIENPAPEFQVQIFHFPGQGGLGSPGSAGTPGTDGSLPGEDFGICRKARKGAPGINGAHGANGENGPEGATEVSQITIAGQKVL